MRTGRRSIRCRSSHSRESRDDCFDDGQGVRDPACARQPAERDGARGTAGTDRRGAACTRRRASHARAGEGATGEAGRSRREGSGRAARIRGEGRGGPGDRQDRDDLPAQSEDRTQDGRRPTVGGLSAVTARILRYHEGRAPELLDRKYAAMAANPFAFYRGSCQLFVDAWPVRSALNDAPAVWSCGDLHFENLGCYKGDNRLVYFDLNDFDEAALLPVSWDLTRFAASVLVGASALRVSAGDATALANLYLDAFGEVLALGRARWVERETATGMARELLDAVRGRKRRTLLGERTKKKGGRRRIRVDGVKALAATREDRARVTRVVEQLGAKLDEKQFYR